MRYPSKICRRRLQPTQPNRKSATAELILFLTFFDSALSTNSLFDIFLYHYISKASSLLLFFSPIIQVSHPCKMIFHFHFPIFQIDKDLKSYLLQNLFCLLHIHKFNLTNNEFLMFTWLIIKEFVSRQQYLKVNARVYSTDNKDT